MDQVGTRTKLIIDLSVPEPGWDVKRKQGVEVFISPEGVEYIHGSINRHDLVVSYLVALGLTPLYLRRLNDISRQRLQWVCPRHKLYTAKRKPRTNCEECWDAYNSKADKTQPSMGREEQGTSEGVSAGVPIGE